MTATCNGSTIGGIQITRTNSKPIFTPTLFYTTKSDSNKNIPKDIYDKIVNALKTAFKTGSTNLIDVETMKAWTDTDLHNRTEFMTALDNEGLKTNTYGFIPYRQFTNGQVYYTYPMSITSKSNPTFAVIISESSLGKSDYRLVGMDYDVNTPVVYMNLYQEFSENLIFGAEVGADYKDSNPINIIQGTDFYCSPNVYTFQFNNINDSVVNTPDLDTEGKKEKGTFPMILTDSEKYTPAETHEQHTPNSIKYTENKTENKSKLPLILGLTLGLGLPILLVISYFIYKKYKK